ncbi:MAG TPA: hypothetical protein VER03_07000 [Bryobacteraceae bacterium]|nr:hypothetical protein [Bryobacteraceae bacterium]
MFVVLLFAAAINAPAPLEIIKTAVQLSEKTDRLRQNYSMTQETISRSPGKESRKTYEMTFRNGKPYRKMVLKDGQPVNGKSEIYTSSEERRFEMLRELPKALDYSHAGEEVIDGEECWVLSAKPKPGYDPPSMSTKFLTQMHAKVWISKKHHRMLKLDAISVGPVSLGGFLAKFEKGTRIQLEQVKVDENVWLPSRFKMTYDGRVLFKSIKGEIEQLSTNFRKINSTT